MENDAPALPPIDLNQADIEALTTLPGIGQVLAERIVEFREKVQPFEEPIEVTAVKGISEGMYQQFADRVAVSPAGQVADLPATDRLRLDATPPTSQALETNANLTSEQEKFVPEMQPSPKDAVGEPTAQVKAASSPSSVRNVPVEVQEKPEVKSTPPAPVSPPPSAGSGCFRALLLMIVSVSGGALLALLILQSINGTLDMATHPRTVRLAEDLSALERQNETLNDEIRLLRGRLDQMETLSGRLRTAEADIQTMQQALAAVKEQIVILEEDSAQVQESIDQIQTATDRFDGFLDGLRDLLLAAESNPTPVVTPAELIDLSPTPTPTTTAAEATATRTPRPTRTPTVTSTPTPTPTPVVPTETPSAFKGPTDLVPTLVASTN